MKKILSTFFIIFTSAIMLTCSNPFKEEEPKKNRVIILVDQTLQEGKWVFYWDGKNSEKEYVGPGKYYYVMDTKDFNEISYMEAEQGGLPGKNNEEHFEAGFWHSFELHEAYPDPFKIKEGVNIPFLVSEPARVKISIFKD